MNLLTHLLHPHLAADNRRAEIYKSLIHWEAQIGGQLFGPVPDGVRREFFCLDRHTWVWHEEWTDNTGRHAMTTRYDVRPTGIVKSQGDSAYQSMSDQELKNFFSAVQMYRQRVVPELNRMHELSHSGK
jgi:hypothetical protein